ncbi:MAG TPA: hypothetical protein VIV59_00110 [Anaeromyxobacteraceae bacterium]
MAARALAATRSREALPSLRFLAGGEPSAPEPSDPFEGVKRFFGADGRCGSGDIAPDAIRVGEWP